MRLTPDEVTRAAINGAKGVVGVEGAKEIAQVVFLRYEVNLEKLKTSPTSGHRSWVWRVARNYAVSALREKTPLDLPRGLKDLYEDRDPLALLIEGERLAANKAFAWQILRGLSTREKMIVTLRLFAGHRWKEVAAIMEINSGTLCSNYARMIQRLRGEFATSQTRRVG